MKKSFFAIIILMFTISCNHKTCDYGKLVLVDSLLAIRQLDSAQYIMHSFYKKRNMSDAEMAYYHLLQTRLDYMLYKPICSDSSINQSIKYFAKNQEKDKLAQAYFYKGVVLYENNKRKQAVNLLKRSEKIAISQNDIRTLNKIYNFLAIVNSNAGENQIAMNYARKGLTLAKQTNDVVNLVDVFNILAISFNGLSQNDSARLYINKCIPLYQYIPSQAKVMILDNIGYLNMDTDPQLALKYLRIAMKLGPSSDTYDNLANIYIKQGLKAKADSLWKEALRVPDISKKCEILKIMLKYAQNERNTLRTAQIASRLIILKDSLAEQRKNEQILEQQIKFDQQMSLAQKQKTIMRLTYAICITMLLLIIFCLIIKNYSIKVKSYKLENEKKIKEYQITIDKLSSIGQLDYKTIENLQKRVDKLQGFNDYHTRQGQILYEAALTSKCIKDWNKPEMTAFLDYYVSKDIEYSLTLEENDLLTPREKVFLILQHEGKTDAKISEMMALSNSALRTMKSRIKKKQESK